MTDIQFETLMKTLIQILNELESIEKTAHIL